MGTRQQGCSCCLATHGDKIEQQLSMKVIPYIEVKKTPLAFIFNGLLVIWCGFDFKNGNKILKINCKLCIFLNRLPPHVVIKGITKIFIHFFCDTFYILCSLKLLMWKNHNGMHGVGELSVNISTVAIHWTSFQLCPTEGQITALML